MIVSLHIQHSMQQEQHTQNMLFFIFFSLHISHFYFSFVASEPAELGFISSENFLSAATETPVVSKYL